MALSKDLIKSKLDKINKVSICKEKFLEEKENLDEKINRYKQKYEKENKNKSHTKDEQIK